MTAKQPDRPAQIRNFAIIAHIDHGKSTLADRLLELTQTVDRRHMQAQVLDSLELEREKGITIKLAPVSLRWGDYMLNLIDTPGHVDFAYEVSKSLQACEGVLLVVDASQGIQAQTLANLYLALEHDLKIIPVINKIDLAAAAVSETTKAVRGLLDSGNQTVFPISAKTGQGVEELLPAITELIPPPSGSADEPLKGLVFDSYYDDYRGVVLYVRLVDGRLQAKTPIHLIVQETDAIAIEVGHLTPDLTPSPELVAGEIGYIVTNLKAAGQARVGDTVTTTEAPATTALAGYEPVKPLVFVGLFPQDSTDYMALKKALAKLSLTDGALVAEVENSPVLGHGWRLGLLGLLHLEIVVERLRREYQVEVITSNPSTAYEVHLNNGQKQIIKNAADLVDPSQIQAIKEPIAVGEIVSRKIDLGAILAMLDQARGQSTNISYVADLVVISFRAPLANLLTDFYDQLKSQTSGYGGLNYNLDEFVSSDLVRVDFAVAGETITALSFICHRQEADRLGRLVVNRLKGIIPRQQFKVALQAMIGGRVIARADLSPYRKDVTAKLYGGDVRRRKKLLQQQKKGKSRLKKFGRVDLPPAVFRVLLERDD